MGAMREGGASGDAGVTLPIRRGEGQGRFVGELAQFGQRWQNRKQVTNLARSRWEAAPAGTALGPKSRAYNRGAMARVVFMGTPEFALPALERLAAGPDPVVAVYTQPDRPAGRGRLVAQPPVKRWALAHAIPVFAPASFRRPEAVEELRALRPDVVVVAAYGKLLPQTVLDVPPKGTLNIHPSLLPRYRGASPVAAAILAGDRLTGVTIILLDAGMDSGPILAQREEPVAPGDTTESLTRRLAAAGAGLLMETLPRWLAGALRPVPQDHAKATLCPRIAKEDGEIDWGRSAEEIERRIRAFYPWPGSSTCWRGMGLKLVRGRPLATDGGPPGTVYLVDAEAGKGKALAIACGRGTLLVEELQPEGKRVMKAQEFLAGYRAMVGERLPSQAAR